MIFKYILKNLKKKQNLNKLNIKRKNCQISEVNIYTEMTLMDVVILQTKILKIIKLILTYPSILFRYII